MLNTILKQYLKFRAKRTFAFRYKAAAIQQNVFLKLLSKGAETQFGKDFGLNKSMDYQSFQQAIPLSTYDELKPYFERAAKGEADVTWPGKVTWFAKSSGTTSDRSKYIPVTQDFLKDTHLQGGRDALAFYTLNKPNHTLFKGKGLIMGGSLQKHPQSEVVNTGDISAVMMYQMPAIARYFLTPSLDLALHDDWEEKLEGMLQCGKEKVTNISGVPTWNLVLLKKLVEHFKAAPISDLWPDLQLYVHGGVAFEPYQLAFREIVGKDIDYLEVYNASEGFFAIQDQLNDPAMLLMLDYGVFYEFVPFEQVHDNQPDVVDIDGVELNKDYALYVSTTAGLWRYQVGDVVRFTSLQPPKIIITGRVSQFVNAFGEELMQHQTDKAIQATCEQFETSLKDYSMAPVYMEADKAKGAHEWIIALEHIPDNKKEWIIKLDEALQTLNSDYAAKRTDDIALQLPIVHFVAKDFFDQWLQSKGKLGGQNKVPRLSNDRKVMEELLGFNSSL